MSLPDFMIHQSSPQEITHYISLKSQETPAVKYAHKWIVICFIELPQLLDQFIVLFYLSCICWSQLKCKNLLSHLFLLFFFEEYL